MITVCIGTYGDDGWKERAEHAALTAGLGVPTVRFHHPDGTIAKVRNEAARQATTDWLCFLDADDQLDPDFITWMEHSIERHPDDHYLHTPAVLQIRGARRHGPMFFPQCSLETGNWLTIGTLISKRLFTEIGGFREHPHGLEDWNLWRRAVHAGAEIIKVKRAVYIAHYNHHSKHHQIRRNRKEYVAAYEAARADI